MYKRNSIQLDDVNAIIKAYLYGLNADASLLVGLAGNSKRKLVLCSNFTPPILEFCDSARLS